MAIILLIAATGTGIWLYQQLDAPHKFWRETMNDLKAQDIMKTSWPGIELLATEETKDVGFEPELPRITNCYRLTISDEEARQLVLSTAVKDGWIENPITDSSYSRSGFKRLDSRSINLTISEKISNGVLPINGVVHVTQDGDNYLNRGNYARGTVPDDG